MGPLSRRLTAVCLSAALVSAQLPARAEGAAPPAPPAPNHAQAMDFFRTNGVVRGPDDPLLGYLSDGRGLTSIGAALYRSMAARYNPREDAQALQPALDKLREQGPYDARRRQSVDRAMQQFEAQLKDIGAGGGDLEDAFRQGALREALLSGAAASDPPKADRYMQIQNGDEFEFWDKEGLAFRVNKQQATTYNRDLQKTQRLMNASRPPDVPFIPETGRYNYNMFLYSWSRLKTQFASLERSLRTDRMIGMAELLGMQLRDDQLLSEKVDPGLEADIIRRAKAKTYTHRGRTYTVFDIVDRKFDQRRAYLYGGEGMLGAKGALDQFERDMKSLERANLVTDGQVATMSLNEQAALRWLSLGVLETQMFFVRGQIEKVDPTAPDAQALKTALDESKLTPQQRRDYRAQGARMAEQLGKLRLILEGVRDKLSAADFAGSLEMSQAALAASQRELTDLSVDYSLYLEAGTGLWLARQQTDLGWNPLAGYNPIRKAVHATARAVWSGHDRRMSEVEGSVSGYEQVVARIASGERADWRAAREQMIKMAPGGGLYIGSGGSPGAEGAKVTDAVRIAAALKAHRERITAVTEANKWLDTASGFATWTISLALMAPLARPALSYGGTRLARLGLDIMQAVKHQPLVVRAVPAVLGRTLFVSGEVMRHVAARLQSLEPGGQWLNTKASGRIGQYAWGIGPRLGSAAIRQTLFTTLSGTMSGAFTLGTHLYDNASLSVGGVDLVRKGYSPFSEDLPGAWEAFWTGTKGGVWWANESFHPLLGYVGLPSSAFRASRFGQYMDVFATRGLVGSVPATYRVIRNAPAAAEAAAGQRVAKGFMERLAEGGAASRGAAFGLSMADNVAKYAMFSHVVGWMGGQYAWYVKTSDLEIPFVGSVNRDFPVIGNITIGSGEQSVERRIKTANATQMTWLMSPAWLLLPVYAGHAARDAAPFQLAAEGMRQLGERAAKGDKGVYKAVLDKGVGGWMDMKPRKPPMITWLFEARLKADPEPARWQIGKEQFNEALYHHSVEVLSAGTGRIADISPLMAYKMLKAKPGSSFVGIPVTDEANAVAQILLVDALIARPKTVLEALDPKNLGRKVEGFGVMRPNYALELANLLAQAEKNLGRKVPAELVIKAGEVLKPYQEASRITYEPTKAYWTRLDGANAPSSGFLKTAEELSAFSDAFFTAKGQFRGKGGDHEPMLRQWREMAEAKVKAKEITRFEAAMLEDNLLVRLGQAGKGDFARLHYLDILPKVRERMEARVKSGEIARKDADGAIGQYEYLLKGVEERLNFFNSVEMVKPQVQTRAAALRVEYAGDARMLKAVDALEARALKGLSEFGPGRIDGPGKAGEKYKIMISDLGRVRREHAGGLPAEQAAALDGFIADVKAAPWVVRDSKGAALSGWRGPQFVSLFEAISYITLTGRAGNAPRIFQMLGTGGGKTMLNFEGLLPLAEYDAARRGKKVIFLTVQSNLEAQAKLEFMAYRRIGSAVEFDTFEGLKTKIADGMTKGRNVLEDYWILGDEMDGAVLQPALTIGMVSGYVTRRNQASVQMSEIDSALLSRIDRLMTEKGAVTLTEARRVVSLLDDMTSAVDPKLAAELRTQAAKLELSASRLRSARTSAESARMEAEVRSLMGQMRAKVEALPLAEAETAASLRASFDRADAALKAGSESSAAAKRQALTDLRQGLKTQERLLGLIDTREGFGRLAQEAGKSRLAVEARVTRLEAELAAAEGGGTRAKSRAGALREQLDAARAEKALLERFESASDSVRLARVQRELAALDAKGEITGPRRARLEAELATGLQSMSPAQRMIHEGYAQSLSRVDGLNRRIAETDRAAQAADAAGDAAGASRLRAELSDLQSQRASARGEIKTREVELGRFSSGGDLGAMMSRLTQAEAAASRLEGQVAMSRARGERAGPQAREAALARREADALRAQARAEVRRRLVESGEEIAALVESGAPGWESAAKRLVERRKALIEAYAGDESAMYRAYREMKNDARPLAENQALLEGVRSVKEEVAGLKAMADQLAAYEKNPAGAAAESMPFLAERAKGRAEIEARLSNLEKRLGENRAAKGGRLEAETLARSLELARAELRLVDRYLALESGGRSPPAGTIAEVVSALDALAAGAGKLEVEVAASLRAKLEGKPWWWFLSKPGALLRAATGRPSGLTVEQIGLTRINALRLLKALKQEPLMPMHQRDALFADFAGSLIFPRGITHRGGSWVHSEVLNMIFGYHESAAGVRVDNKARRFNVVHNGQWFESMDNPGRRWWELEYGVDLTLPYTHDAISTIKDVTTFKKGRFISFSGTAGPKFVRHMLDYGVIKSGLGSQMPELVVVDPVNGQAARITRIRESFEGARARSKDLVLLTPSDLVPPEGAEAAVKARYDRVRAEIEAFGKTSALPLGDNFVLEIPKLQSAETQQFLRELRAKQGDTSLVVLSVSDTRVLKDVLRYLEKSVGLKPDQIAKVFSDTEYLRQNVNEANVIQQMNLAGLDTGKVKVLILDSRVGGRGLDLNFKGDRASTAPDAFRGYTNFEMLVIDPHEMSQVHLLQSFGRIDANRVHAAAPRSYSMVLDVKGALKEPVFESMFANDAFFAQMRRDPSVQRYALEQGKTAVDLPLIHDYIHGRVQRARRSGASDQEAELLMRDYHDSVRTALEKRQAQVEEEGMRASSVLQDRPNYPSRNAPLELLRR